jgi:hypothetical protein
MDRRNDHKLVRFLIRNALLGIAAGWSLLVLLLYTDAFGLGQLVRASEQGWLAVLMLAAGFAITFGSAAMGTAIFLLRPDEEEDED